MGTYKRGEKNMKGTKFVTYTAVMLALLVAVQAITAPFGQLVTGSLVNFILIAACILVDWKSGLIIAVLSPFIAKLFGIGPAFLLFIPIVSIGNASLVGIYSLSKVKAIKINQTVKRAIAVVLSAVVKYLVLSIGIGKIAVMFINIPEQKIQMITKMFGITQLFTALIGGVLAIVLIPLISYAVKHNK